MATAAVEPSYGQHAASAIDFSARPLLPATLAFASGIVASQTPSTFGLAVTLLLVGAALGTFDTVLILTGGGPGTETVTPALYSYTAAFQVSNWPIGAASAWLIVIAVLMIGAVYLSLTRKPS